MSDQPTKFANCKAVLSFSPRCDLTIIKDGRKWVHINFTAKHAVVVDRRTIRDTYEVIQNNG